MADARASSFQKATQMAIEQSKGEGASTYAVSSYNGSLLRNQIIETHHSDELTFALKPVLDIIEVIFSRTTTDLHGNVQASLANEKVLYSGHQDILVELPIITAAVSREVFCNWFKGVAAHNTTMDILHIIKHYSWDAKLVLAVGSFAMSFGGFRLVSELHSTNPIAKAVALLKNFPQTLELAGILKSMLEAIFLVVKAILDMTKSVIELYELSHNEYFTAESPEIIAATADIPTAVYWTIQSTVDCASQIMSLTAMDPEYLSKSWELSSLAHKLEMIRSQLVKQINLCYKFIEKKKDDEIFNSMARVLETSHIDNSISLNLLFREKDGSQPMLYDCLHQNLVPIEDLKGKVVGLYITDLNIVSEDYLILQQIYPEKLDDRNRIENQYEIVWIPVMDNWTNDKYWQFENLRDQMEWLSVRHPSQVALQVIRYIREICNFVKKPLLVVMDTDGKIVHKDATQMMCIWGNQAYPFSLAKEMSLWQQRNWTISLLAEGIDQYLPTWIEERKHICLYGGEDMEWIRSFTRTAKAVALRCGIELEMLYAGKNRSRERVVKKMINVTQRERLSKALEWKLISYFWLRMEKMCVSEPPPLAIPEEEGVDDEFFMPDDLYFVAPAQGKMRHSIFTGIVNMLSFGSSSKGWAVISGDTEKMLFEADGELLLKALFEHEKWKERAENDGFVRALEIYYHQLCNDLPHCISLILSDTELKGISCAACNKPMEKMVKYSCCTDRASFGYD
ncbi:protein SIEVE ELEMENT OCCLUSION B-like isoform X2 [Humulus lupulus]|uniref:protein SIEVE ELEMENT OCCLUSION B-like isoform X2 n=1 Tax=Humulus lupulus TaxID=3486 RepID=UPI002B4095D1|nr:protein SIEVE ELEMENT OCCLUSION B-like isoform X2 [Humulus lupulus]